MASITCQSTCVHKAIVPRARTFASDRATKEFNQGLPKQEKTKILGKRIIWYDDYNYSSILESAQ
ncbi:hypothetical protein IQ238_28075 [Pleurocapsales cyanobacterium LEGE 06147]|nr:hypothetical protein [Pleurocapsales cyanobacterium LEGE 06147]